MGRKGVSKRKKAKEKAAPVIESNSALSGRNKGSQPVQVTEKVKASHKDKKKN